MKNAIVLCVMMISAAALFAQPQQPPEQVTVTGKLALVNGHIALQSGEDVWYVTGIERLVGFVDGLKEGAEISLEGYAWQFARQFARQNVPGGNVKMLWSSRLTISGRSYDLAPAGMGPRSMGGQAAPGWGPGPGTGPGRFGPMPGHCWGPGRYSGRGPADPGPGHRYWNNDGRRGRR